MQRIPGAVIAVCVSVVLLAASFPSAGSAQEEACKSDAEKLCPGMEPGQGRILNCLKEKMDQVSPECKTYLAGKAQDVKAKKGAWDQACGKDVDQYCKGVSPGGGAVLNCLKEHKADLSKECQAFLADKGQEIKAKKESWDQACSKDVSEYCKGVEPGQGRILKCLKEHEASLSAECKALIAR